MLDEFITINREEIVQRCRAKVATRSTPMPSRADVDHGVPLFLDQLIDALRSGAPRSAEIDQSAGRHGHDLLRQGFSVSQVVHDYGDVCQTITELAMETDAPIGADDFRTLNRCLDEAIAGAVTKYSQESQQLAFASLREATGRSNERVKFLVHELRNLLNTAIVAFEVLKSGNVGVAGSTGAVLQRSLVGIQHLVAHSLDEVRMTKGPLNRKRIVLSDFIADVAAASTLAANARGIALVVSRVPDGLAVEADPHILAAIVGNLLQNALKFTQPHTTVTLRVVTAVDRLRIEVEDECGGLTGIEDEKETIPSFEQQAADQSGLGVGLAFSRWGAEANGGRLYARNLPDKGCVFSVDFPIAGAHTEATV